MTEKMGEEPVIYSSRQTSLSAEQMRLYMKNLGYYHSIVDTIVTYENKKAHIKYAVNPGIKYVVDTINYTGLDTILLEVVLLDTINSKLKSGMAFDVTVLNSERTQIARRLQNLGYYKFNQSFIHYYVDTTLTGVTGGINITVEVKPFEQLPDGKFKPHQRYIIDQLHIFTNYDVKQAIIDKENYVSKFVPSNYRDALYYNDEFFNIKPNIIWEQNYLFPSTIYSTENVERTYKHLFALKTFKHVTVDFVEKPYDPYFGPYLPLDANIRLTPFKTQSYMLEAEGTNTSGNLGIAGNLKYRHKNIFRGAEILDLKLKAALERQIDVIGNENPAFNTSEYGFESMLTLPVFLFPIKNTGSFKKAYNPKSTLKAGINYRQRTDYSRIIGNFSIGYLLFGKNNPNLFYFFNPIEINLIKVSNLSETFLATIQDPVILSSYENRILSVSNIQIAFNNRTSNKPRTYSINWTAESAGNLLSSYFSLQKNNSIGVKEIFNVPFAQYVKTDLDFRKHSRLSKRNTMVYRFFAGVAVPYGNSVAIPFIKKYYSGGANSLRAWRVRNLGPGSFAGDDNLYPNQTGDMKLELNIEYRFKIFGMFEGAAFIDAGNIWSVTKSDSRDGSLFDISTFYKTTAVGYGLGLRLDFDFFIFRTDVGIKLIDPALVGNTFVPSNPNATEYVAFNFGIGYPF